jgi:hypothetical protein
MNSMYIHISYVNNNFISIDTQVLKCEEKLAPLSPNLCVSVCVSMVCSVNVRVICVSSFPVL